MLKRKYLLKKEVIGYLLQDIGLNDDNNNETENNKVKKTVKRIERNRKIAN